MKIINLFSRIFILIFTLQSCENQTNKVNLTVVNFEEFQTDLSDFVQVELKQKFQIDSIQVESQKLPKESYYEPRNRYRADVLIRYLQVHSKTNKIIGLTHKDISTTIGNYPDWGIMGLAFRPGKSCVVSTFRTFRGAQNEQHKKERLKKVVFHEFGHTLGLPHCVSDKTCLMKDAHGKVSTVDETIDFCTKCQNNIQKYLK